MSPTPGPGDFIQLGHATGLFEGAVSGVEPNIYAATEPAEGAPGGNFVIFPVSPNPSIIGSTAIAGRATQIQAAGSYAYVTTDAGLMLAISTSTPTNPMVSGVYGSEVGSLSCIDVAGNIAAVGGANGVAILDLANLSPILSLSTFGISNAASVHIVGNRLYVGTSAASFVMVYDISNPAAPNPVGGFSAPGAVGSALGITQIGSIVYESAGAGGFQLFEESTDPLGGLIFNPLGSFGTSAISADLSSSGNIGFVASGDVGKLSAVNLSNPAAPSEGATFLDPSLFPQAPHSVAVVGGMIVYSRGRGGIYILAHPDLIPPTPTPFPTDTPSPSPTASPVPTDSPTPSASPTASPTPSPSFTPSISPTPSPTPAPIPLTITGDLAAGALTQSAPHTLTFTFSAPVSGFTGDDVVVTGATKGTFSTISSLQYTLGVTGTGGTATATVADGAATGIATGGQSLASNFSFFYQDTWTISLPGSASMDLIHIPAGTFTMGSPTDELSRSSNEVQHQVTLTQDFYLGRTEVTQKQWLAIRGSWPGSAPSLSTTGDDYPAYNISWNDTQDFLTDLNTVITEPGTFSLPTESQWEYACRAGTTTRFSFGPGLGSDELCSTGTGRELNMWYCGNNTPDGQKIVGQKFPNAWGLRDMHGNVWELCADWYDPYTGDVTDPTGPASGVIKVIRGGDFGSTAPSCRSAIRQFSPPATRSGSIGFRVAAVRPSP